MPLLLLTLVIPLLIVSLPRLALADTEFADSIPVETARALLASPFGAVTFYTDIVDEFPEFEIPDEFSVLGSVDNVMSLRAVFETRLDEQAATGLAISALLDEGWQRLPAPVSPIPRVGFVSASDIYRDVTRLCHDGHGNISVYYTGGEDANLVRLELSGRSFGRQRTCEIQISESNQSMTMMQARLGQGIRQYMPRLEIPAQQRRPGWVPFVGGGSSSSNSSAEAETTIATDLSMDELFQHFAAQMTAQGWVLDTRNTGSVTATGNWTRSPATDLDLISTLTIIASGDSAYDLKLTVVNPGGRNSGFGIFRN